MGFFLFISCEKKDKPISLPPKGDGNLMQVDMGGNYDVQFYVDLSQNKIVHTSLVDSWDLAFQSGSNQHTVFLNGGKGMAAYNSMKTKFEDVSFSDTTKAKLNWSYDSPTGIEDSAAIGEWKTNTPIYLIKLNEAGTRVRKLQILSEDAFEYKIAVGDVASTVPVVFTVVKNPTTNFTYFSFDLLKTIDGVEPPKDNWDFQITRYNYSFFDQNPILRYVVNGALLNPYKTSAYKDSLNDYNSINTSFIQSLSYSTNRDVIGYDWKTYDFANGNYTIVKKYNFIIQDQDNHHFKMHFLDFYSSTGVKGSPKFEFLQLD